MPLFVLIFCFISTMYGGRFATIMLAVGKRADQLLLKRNPLTDIHNMTAIAGVMIGGRWLSRAELDRQIDPSPSVVQPGGALTASAGCYRR